jgi:hypothetical protein
MKADHDRLGRRGAGCSSPARPLLLFLGLPVAFSFLAINLLGAWLWLGGEPGLRQLARNSVSSVMSFSLTPIPLFVLMGEVLFHTGLAVKVIDGIERLIAQVPGASPSSPSSPAPCSRRSPDRRSRPRRCSAR